MSITPSAPSSIGQTLGSSSAVDNQQAFRDADFMKILLAEITQQDPFEPQDTAQIVTGMQKLQELANTRYEKFRDDQRWARDIMGQSVSVQEYQTDQKALDKLKEQGLNPGVGYLTVTGTVDHYRVLNEAVWVHVDGKDYPLDNVSQVRPPSAARTGADLGSVASGMLGYNVRYRSEDGLTRTEGRVTAVELDDKGDVQLTVGAARIPVSRVERISLTG